MKENKQVLFEILLFSFGQIDEKLRIEKKAIKAGNNI